MRNTAQQNLFHQCMLLRWMFIWWQLAKEKNTLFNTKERSTCLHDFLWRQTTCRVLTNNNHQTKQAKETISQEIKHPETTYLAPTDTSTTLSRLSLHHSSTSWAKVALNRALLTRWEVQARKMEASWSRNPDFPSSNSLSDSSTTSHSTLEQGGLVFRRATGEWKSTSGSDSPPTCSSLLLEDLLSANKWVCWE